MLNNYCDEMKKTTTSKIDDKKKSLSNVIISSFNSSWNQSITLLKRSKLIKYQWKSA